MCERTVPSFDRPSAPPPLDIEPSPKVSVSETSQEQSTTASDLPPPSTAPPSLPLDSPDVPFTKKQRIVNVALYLVASGILYTSSNVMAPNLDAMAKSFGFSAKEKDAKLAGQVSAVFFSVGAPAALLSGFLAGRMNRRLLLAIIAALSFVPMILTYFVRQYALFFVFRAITGLSLGAVYPALFSVLADFTPRRHRSTVAGLVSLASGAGTLIGQGGAGFIGPPTNW